MARGGLEPPTPRFSGVSRRVRRIGHLQGFCNLRAAGDTRRCRGIPGGLGPRRGVVVLNPDPGQGDGDGERHGLEPPTPRFARSIPVGCPRFRTWPARRVLSAPFLQNAHAQAPAEPEKQAFREHEPGLLPSRPTRPSTPRLPSWTRRRRGIGCSFAVSLSCEPSTGRYRRGIRSSGKPIQKLLYAQAKQGLEKRVGARLAAPLVLARQRSA
jgi:hypothetical protein